MKYKIKCFNFYSFKIILSIFIFNQIHECDETISSILLNSHNLLRLDLNGINVLIPYIIETLELVLPERELKLK